MESNLTLLRAVFDMSEDGIFITSDQGVVLDINQRFYELFSVSENLVGQTSQKIFELLHRPPFFDSRGSSSTQRLELPDGRTFYCQDKPLEKEGRLLGKMWSFKDMTEQLKGQEVLRAITDLSPDIISIIDADGNLVFNSPASKRIHGYEEEELLGKNTLHLIHPDDLATVGKVMGELLEAPGNIGSVQYRYQNKDGTYVWMEATAVNQMQNPLVQGLVAISRNVEQRKRLEMELEEALRMRDEFMSIASHELKTPVASIKLQLQILQRLGKGLSSAPGVSKIESMDGMLLQINSLQRLIEDLLNVSRIRMGLMTHEPVQTNFSYLIELVLGRFEKMFEEAQCPLNVKLQSDIHLPLDPIRMEQVLINLFSNAIKYAPGAQVDVELRLDGNHAVFSIFDNGPGIPNHKHETIFNLFERGLSKSNVSGMGIGLYVCKCIISLHKGTIDVTDNQGKGTGFILRLPLA